MRSLVLFDIDHTLYDTDKFIDIYRKSFTTALHISPEDLDKCATKYFKTLQKSTDFLPEDFIKHIANTHSKKTEHILYKKLHNLYFEQENFTKSLYSDTFSTLKSLSQTHDIGIFSEGHRSFQIKKLIKTKIIDYLNTQYMYINRRKTEPDFVAQLPDSATVVDDNLEVLKALQKYPEKKFQLVWINRDSAKNTPHIRTIHSLTELT